MQLLLQKGVLENRNLLIIDEPENHLHPKWQIEYAKLLIEIMKKGVKIIINTHSVYMIQAIKHFSQKEENKSLLNKVTFYLAEKQKNGLSKIVDVSDDLNKVFKKLAEPLREIAWK